MVNVIQEDTDMDFNELAESRRSIRGFEEKDVPDNLIMKLLLAAQTVPSGGNCQPWHFYVIKDNGVLAKIGEKAYKAPWLAPAPVAIVVCADMQKSERYGERGRDLYCIQDTAAAIQNILLCAKSLGLGTCWCGAFSEPAITEILNLKKDVLPVAIIPIGYYSNEPSMPQRRFIDEIVTFI
jgi:nitroreductase